MTEATTTLHYLNIGLLGLGEPIRLFLKDAAIEFNDIRYKYDDTWPTTSKMLKDAGISKTGKVPVLEYKGNILSQHVPILRYLAQDIGGYDGVTMSEKHLLDVVADIYGDWRTQWITQLSAKTDKYKNETVPQYYRVLDVYYSIRKGPFLLGDQITWTDFAVYQSIDNDIRIGTIPEELPKSIVEFKAAFEVRPNIAPYLKERK